MKPIKFAYAKIPNMGDLLNEFIMDRVFCVPYKHTRRVWEYELTGIGSFLDNLFYGEEKNSKNPLKRYTKNFLLSTSRTECYTWGTGFIKDVTDSRTRLSRPNVHFMAVRGQKSKESVEKILGHEINPVLGDGGILTPYMFDKPIPKKYKIGIIPHFREQDCPQLGYLIKQYPEAHIINLRGEPLQVMQEIAECEIIISSSLHGLILADAFRIPNMRIYLTDAPKGTGFKFDDYYSAYGLDVPARIISSEKDVPNINELIDNYQVTDEMVKTMQNGMYDCLNTHLKNRN